MPDVAAYAIDSPTGRYHRTTISRREPGPTEVYFGIAYTGICHSDIHTARGEWGPIHYPFVGGHEIAGVVRQVGSEVTRFQVGDRVGVGCFVDSCRTCEMCLQGEEQFCTGRPGAVWTYNGTGRDGLPTDGGYSQGITVEQDYLMRVPEQMRLEHAAPLMCAGITLYSPLKRWGAAPGKRVGIVGMGGLGHMGVQIAAAMGAETIVLGRTLAKRDDGLKLGATDYVSTQDRGVMKSLRGSFDLIVTTVSDGVELDSLLKLLKAHGVLVNVGLPENASSVHLGVLTGQARVLAGSNIGGIRETQEMLDFCAENGLAPIVEIIGADQIDEAYDNVVASKVRYRYVIDIATI
ncbi:NAD(P)-dependent alcohol dehydrogenase [Tessaracoccus sp. MC1679]|uniref:NAD(P)-dependent alcohol dehydrogenase n=1 Tax=Tessaracoccus sp. MC1679 TaxID=2760313 RepID=UPI0016042F5B|nr:NAD(P)-dependent alcohol dehydrogenase [Tessaracoccus sp. MC1679]MBB1517236.1 NAD(P)-dependent alcohol dehydrogenase [Tessaracoccus sp. MC1679]